MVIVLLIVGFVLLKQRGGTEVMAPTGEEVPAPQSQTATSTEQPKTQAEVIYNASGFNPKTLTIKAGETVVFKNNSSKDFWPASAVHPTHAIYPEFDAKKAIEAGGTYSFTFTRVGSWKYHNHLNPADTGTITVQ